MQHRNAVAITTQYAGTRKHSHSNLPNTASYNMMVIIYNILHVYSLLFPQQCELMGSSAQNSSGVRWCRRRVRFNEFPEKVPKVPEKVGRLWCRASSRPTGFWRRFWRRSGRLSCRARSGSTGLGEGSGEGFEEGSRKPWCKKTSQVQQGSGEGSGKGSREGRGGFGAEPGQVQEGWEKVPEKVPEKAGKGLGGFGAEPGQIQQGLEKVSEKVPEKVGEALVQSQVRFNRVPEKVPGKVWEASVQGQVKFNRVLEKVPEKVWEALVQRLWCRARAGLQDLRPFNSWKPS